MGEFRFTYKAVIEILANTEYNCRLHYRPAIDETKAAERFFFFFFFAASCKGMVLFLFQEKYFFIIFLCVFFGHNIKSHA